MSGKLIIALDNVSLENAYDLAKNVGDAAYALKMHDLFDAYGSVLITALKNKGAKRVWVDAKLHDIPATGGHRAQTLKDHGADIITVHASGGIAMMEQAVASGAEIFAVTVLTSLSKKECRVIYNRTPLEQVTALAHLAKQAGCAGIVCSPKEVAALARDPLLKGMKFITPGVRSVGEDTHDQARVTTPLQALQNGATHLVIGRQVTTADDPKKAFEQIEAEIK